jgi:hypothetical protein
MALATLRAGRVRNYRSSPGCRNAFSHAWSRSFVQHCITGNACGANVVLYDLTNTGCAGDCTGEITELEAAWRRIRGPQAKGLLCQDSGHGRNEARPAAPLAEEVRHSTSGLQHVIVVRAPANDMPPVTVKSRSMSMPSSIANVSTATGKQLYSSSQSSSLTVTPRTPRRPCRQAARRDSDQTLPWRTRGPCG